MKIVRVYKNQIAFVSQGNIFNRALTEGIYYIKYNENIVIHRVVDYIKIDSNIELMRKDLLVNENFKIIEITDFEVGIYYEGENFKNVLISGKYLIPKNIVKSRVDIYNTKENEIDNELSKTVLNNLNYVQLLRIFRVQSFEVGLLFINGDYTKKLNAGTYYFWNNGKEIKLETIDLRTQSIDLTGQEILTKDKCNIRINFNARYNVVDEEKALLENNDFKNQLYLTMQMALREYISSFTLDEILGNKSEIERVVLELIKKKETKLGLNVLDCGIKDIILPGDIREIINKVLIAEKTAIANSIKRREETASTRSLLNTAKLMEDNKMLFNLKQMEYIETIAEKVGNITINGNSQILGQLKQIFEVEG